ncbi:hypothetical protein CK203_070816 [Vitis vinifera]|uniref:Uncharacterized protein n=1 Tax=Vitis vinifera TaxID=29760 RepID=A0A438E470_VITVI|nr:hypothetical protein CK203_070816 [Vitis vinifera]
MVSCHTDHRWWTTQRGNWLLGQLQLPFTQPATFYCQWKMYLASDLVNSCLLIRNAFGAAESVIL